MEHPSFHVQHYIDGAFVEGTRRFEIFYPATNQVIGSAPEGREDEVDAAVQAATRAFASWGRASATERRRVLRAFCIFKRHFRM